MSFACDPQTRIELSAVTDKRQWISVLNAAVGNTRRIRCFRDSNPFAADPVATGVEFRNVGSTGAFTSSGGMITKLGRIKGTTISLAADMKTGKSVLRVEGNGRWFQGTLGLSNLAQIALGITEVVAYDFVVDRNFTAINGLGITSKLTLSGYHLLASGTGPKVPESGADTPDRVEVWDHTVTPPALLGSIPFDLRRDDWVYEDAEMAEEIGDVGVIQSTKSVVHGLFEFGATLLVSTHTNTETLDKPLYQVLVYAKPYSQGWNTYPTIETYSLKTQTTVPKAFKAILKSANNVVLHTFEMHDGLPINSPLLSQRRDDKNAIRPFWNCMMMLPWQNAEPSLSIHQKKRFNGMNPEVLRPKIGKWGDTVNARYPLVSAQWSANSLNHMWALPKWPMTSPKRTADGTTEDWTADRAYVDSVNPGPRDPNLFDIYGYRNYEGLVSRTTGWGYEPGSNGGHDWYSAPGGPRHDRAVVPSVLAVYLTDKNFIRPDGNVPFKEMVKHWGLTYFNHSSFYITDVHRMSTVDKQSIINGEWSYNWGYYSVRPATNQFPLNRVVEISAVTNANEVSDGNVNGDGLQPTSGWAPDALHGYNAPSLWPLIFNSPMHSIAGVHRFITQRMAALGDGSPKQNPWNYFMTRVHAWRWMHYVFAWKNGSTHELGIAKAPIEDALQIEMELIWDNIYKPTVIDQVENDLRCVVLRRLGVISDYDGNWGGFTAGASGLGYYMTHVFAFMKNLGMWEVMKNKSTKCRDVMKFMIQCFAKGSVDFILDTKGHKDGYPPVSRGGQAWPSMTAADIPANWKDYNDNFFPPNGLEDWIRGPDGVIMGYEREVNVHWRAQWPSMHATHFPEEEYAYPRLAEGVAKYEAYDAAMKNNWLTKKDFDWHYRYPSQGFLRAPGVSDPARQ